MPLPQYRYVSELDYGVNRYQCLNCKNAFNTDCSIDSDHSPRWKYCPYCGICWTGRRSFGENKWKRLYEWFGKPLRHYRTVKTLFMLANRTKFTDLITNNNDNKWEQNIDTYGFYENNAYETIQMLNQAREQARLNEKNHKIINTKLGFCIDYGYMIKEYKIIRVQY